MTDRIRVLAVDDEKLVRMNLGVAFERAGFEVDLAACETEARALLARRHYDVVVTDVDLPDGDGRDLVATVRLVEPATKVIILTGSESLVSEAEAMAGGAAALVLKPFKLADIVSAVRSAVGAGPLLGTDAPAPGPAPARPSASPTDPS